MRRSTAGGSHGPWPNGNVSRPVEMLSYGCGSYCRTFCSFGVCCYLLTLLELTWLRTSTILLSMSWITTKAREEKKCAQTGNNHWPWILNCVETILCLHFFSFHLLSLSLFRHIGIYVFLSLCAECTAAKRILKENETAMKSEKYRVCVYYITQRFNESIFKRT